ncbi:MAG: acyl--CoA ligase [Novosphingobium sp.]|nr:acyl--CoA ligase [Novosphingobium sp.]
MGEHALKAFLRVNEGLTAPGAPYAIENGEDPARRRYAGTQPNFVALGQRARERFGPQPFIEMDGRVLTFEEVFAAADRLAGFLSREHGVAKGDRVGIAMRNQPEWFIAYFAVMRLGAISALLNSRGAPEEICATAEQVGCKAVIADEARSERVRDMIGCPLVDFDMLGRIVADNSQSPPEIPDLGGDDPAIIIFTSGTTGRPKGATLTHRNLCHVAREMELRAEAGLIQAAEQLGMEADALRRAMPPPAPTLLVTPLFHISGVVGMLMALHIGSSIILVRKWNPEQALDIIEERGVSSLSGPSLIFADLLALPDAGRRMRTLRGCAVAGQATPLRLAEELREQVPEIGVTSCWGQTECSGAATTGNREVFAGYPGTVGPAAGLIDIRVVDADGNEVPRGEIGELLVRGPTVMCGYWGDEEANAKALRDGWLCSGDLGYVDPEGLVYIADRAKDMVIAGGQNIYCAEVERVLSMLPQQAEVALFGVEDDRLGERAVAAVTLREGEEGTLDDVAVKAHVRAHLADYKIPTEVRFDLGPFPRNALGKIDKAKLVSRFHELAPARAS